MRGHLKICEISKSARLRSLKLVEGLDEDRLQKIAVTNRVGKGL